MFLCRSLIRVLSADSLYRQLVSKDTSIPLVRRAETGFLPANGWGLGTWYPRFTGSLMHLACGQGWFPSRTWKQKAKTIVLLLS